MCVSSGATLTKAKASADVSSSEDKSFEMEAVGRIKSSQAAWARQRKGRRSCCTNIEMKAEKKKKHVARYRVS